MPKEAEPIRPTDASLRLAVGVAPIATLVVDGQGFISLLNQQAEVLFGYAQGELIGRPMQALVPHKHRTLDSGDPPGLVEAAVPQPSVQRPEVRGLRKDGSEVALEIGATLLEVDGKRFVLNSILDISDRKRSEERLAEAARQHAALFRFVAQLQTSESLGAIYDAGLDAMIDGLRCNRASVLVADEENVMRFVGWRGLSDEYRQAVEGHSAWAPDERDPQPVLIDDVETAPIDEALLRHLRSERISALGFFPLVVNGTLAGKFMTYYDTPHTFPAIEVEVAMNIARQLALAIERKRAEQTLRASEQRLRLALEAGGMGSWEWNLRTNEVDWSLELEAIHGLAAGTFDGTFEAYRRDIHPDDFERVQHQIKQSLEGGDHHLEYRIVRPDGSLRWVEGRGKVFRDDAGAPSRVIGVCTDITGRKVAEAAAKDAERRKDEFLATLAHELRNPLAPLTNALQLLKARADDTGTRQKTMEIMERQLAQMVRLVDDLMDINRVSRGSLTLRRERVTMAAVIQRAIETNAPIAAQRRQEVEVTSTDDVWLDGDAARLAQMLGNLVHNACKFTPDGGRITIKVHRDAHEVAIDVTDNGIGIDSEHRESIFAMFSQVDRSITRSQGGLGIGLALARRIAEMHGGRIAVTSDGIGKGSTFSVRLPIPPALPASPMPTQDRPTNLFGRRRFLVVEDNQDAASSLAMMLSIDGHEVAVAHDGNAAFKAAMEMCPDTVLLDIGLPGMSGYEICKKMRTGALAPNTVIVALSGWGQEDDRRRSKEAGFDAHLVKPVDFDTLAALLATMGGDRGDSKDAKSSESSTTSH